MSRRGRDPFQRNLRKLTPTPEGTAKSPPRDADVWLSKCPVRQVMSRRDGAERTSRTERAHFVILKLDCGHEVSIRYYGETGSVRCPACGPGAK